jgi:ribonuclease D
VLAGLAAWREREARRVDRPTAWVMPDRTLVELARRRPGTRRALEAERGVPERLRDTEADAILAAILAGQEADPISMPSGASPDLQNRAEVLAPLASAVVAARAEAAGLAPSLLATRDDISRYLVSTMQGEANGHPLAQGWRHEIAGAALADLVAGRLAVAAHPTRPYLIEIPRDPADDAG